MILFVCNEFKGDKMYKRVVTHSMLAVSVAALIVGCGGSDSTSDIPDSTQTVTGTFVDAPVDGLNYDCSTGTDGVTHDGGQFTCNEGDTVTFMIGKYVLGTTNAVEGVITPVTLYPDDAVAATDVMQLLQSIDNPDDGTITIPSDFDALDDVEVKPGDQGFDDEVEKTGIELVKPWDALAHAVKTTMQGNTLYTTIENELGTLESWTLNDDLTSLTWKELSGENETGTCSVEWPEELTGEPSTSGYYELNIGVTCEEDEEMEKLVLTIPLYYMDMPEYTPLKEDYLQVLVAPAADESDIVGHKLFFDETKAKEFFYVGKDISIFAGQTLYVPIYDESGTLESWTFNDDFKSVKVQELIGGSESETITIESYEDFKMKLKDDSDDVSYIKIVDRSDDHLYAEIYDEDSEVPVSTIPVFFNEEDAKEYLGISE
jgi:hypothetical protein